MEYFIIKRDGVRQKFNPQKIKDAILKAFYEVDGEISDYAKTKADNIANYIEGYMEGEPDELTIDEIQSLVEHGLMSLKQKDVATAYIEYRHERDLSRKNTMDDTLSEMLKNESEYWTKENSNKNSKILTTQRDYMAGIMSTDYSRRYILPKDVVQAHDKGAIHIHDLDYLAENAITNCFRGDTRFISMDGVRPFCSYNDGDEVFVPTHTGEWKKAIVKKYGVQPINKITLKRGCWSERTIYATGNHRWLLKDGTETTNLKINDHLIQTPDISHFEWEDLSIEQKRLWGFGFAYGDGSMRNGLCYLRLCGKKNQYIPMFEDAGFNITYPPHLNGEASVAIGEYDKNTIPSLKTPEDVKIFIYGLLCADGHHTNVKGGNSKNEFRGIQVTGQEKNDAIFDLLNAAGYYVSSINDLTNCSTNYGERSDTTKLYRIQNNQTYRNWKVINIEKNVQKCEVWCLEVEDNHSFILEGGIVTGNCCLINLEDMLQNGTVVNNEMIEKPHRFITAMTIATQIMLGVSSSQYGGETITVSHLAPFVRDSYNRFLNKYLERGVEEEKAKEWAELDTRKEISDGVQTFNYQLNSMTNTNGQSPFCTVFFYLNENPEYTKEIAMITEEFFKQRIQGIKNKAGVYVTQAFPKLIYCLDENNITEDSEYWWLTKLAAECTAKRMVPDYISAKVMKELKQGDVYPSMGCRSFLTPDPVNHKYWGRFNIGVSTVNLPYVALEAKKENKDFFEVLDKYLNLCHKAQKIRLQRLENVTSDVAPILWQNGAFARLAEGASLHELLHDNYCTSSLGYAGLYEAVMILTGESHSKRGTKGYNLGIKIMQHLNDACSAWREAENVSYSLYGTPIESTTFKFAKALKKDFDIIEGVTDKDYVTNSYHVTPSEEISAFDKIDIEADFQRLSPGGAISYIEVGNLQKNIPAVLQLLQYMYDKIMYCEMNTKSDYCYNCGYDGEIEIKKDENGKFYWQCPCCGNQNEDRMAVTRRVCGYLGTNGYNQGRMNDIADRYVHLQ